MSDIVLSLYVKPGSASAEEIAEVLTAFSDLYKAYGGSGLVFEVKKGKQVLEGRPAP